MRRGALLLSALLLAGCAPQAPSPKSATEAAATPFKFPSSLRWMRNSAEYRAITLQTYRQALSAAERLSSGLAPGTWAVSVDVDETILDNSQFEKERQLAGGGPVDMAKWREWVRRRERRTVPGAWMFLTGVQKLGGKVAVVTNTQETLCTDVAANLDSQKLPYDILLCRPDAEGDRKEGRWKAVGEGNAKPGVGPLQILVWVGDNIQDFPDESQELRSKPDTAFDEFGRRYFALPNPIYGTWEKNPAE